MEKPSNYLKKRQVLIKIWVENAVSTIQHIGNGKSFLGVLFPIDQANPFAYSCSFIKHTPYQNDMLEQRRGEGYQNAHKQIIINGVARTLKELRTSNGD